MRNWSLAKGDPLSLTLAADARLSIPDYINDHSWELLLGGGEPGSLSLRSTCGLRAKSMRLFLRFGENGKTVLDPSSFTLPPTVRRFYSNSQCSSTLLCLTLTSKPSTGFHSPIRFAGG